MLDPNRCYRALASRDRRFDGRFFVAVRTTGIYCRPICPARTPKRENVEFFASAAAAEAAGYRACRRCRPETAPGTPAWEGSAATVTRALRLIREGALDAASVESLASRLGVGARQLRRLFERHLGASPGAVARALRTHFARTLVEDSDLALTEVAFAAGFRSVRQFHHAFRASFGAPPSELRRARANHPSEASSDLVVRVPVRPPYDWDALVAFLAPRAIPGVEAVSSAAYRRTIRIGAATGALEVTPLLAENALRVRVRGWGGEDLFPVVERVRRLFDVAADPAAIAAQLRRDARLRPLVDAAPGLRVPGAFDAFELAVRAILGQQVTVAGATTLCARLVRAFGTPVDLGDGLTHLFPNPERLADASVAAIGIPGSRARTLTELARAVASGALVLDASRGLDDVVERLCALPGVGPWTAHYIAMRACAEPDAFPASDLGLRKAAASGGAPLSEALLVERAEAWSPWRAYAAMYLWHGLAVREVTTAHGVDRAAV